MIKEVKSIEEFNLEKINGRTKYFVFIDKNINKGYIAINDLYDFVDIINIYVKEEYRNQKIGSQLLDTIINYCNSKNIKTITLEVNNKNNVAINLYLKYGFKKEAIRTSYYNGEDGILMVKKW